MLTGLAPLVALRALSPCCHTIPYMKLTVRQPNYWAINLTQFSLVIGTRCWPEKRSMHPEVKTYSSLRGVVWTVHGRKKREKLVSDSEPPLPSWMAADPKMEAFIQESKSQSIITAPPTGNGWPIWFLASGFWPGSVQDVGRQARCRQYCKDACRLMKISDAPVGRSSPGTWPFYLRWFICSLNLILGVWRANGRQNNPAFDYLSSKWEDACRGRTLNSEGAKQGNPLIRNDRVFINAEKARQFAEDKAGSRKGLDGQ